MIIRDDSKIPAILKGGTNGKILPVVPAQKISKYNKNQRRFHEQEKNDVKTTAAILRISEQGKSKARTG
jgi:ribosomal protein L32